MTQFNQFIFALFVSIMLLVLLWGYIRHNRRILENTGVLTPFLEKWNTDPYYHWTIAGTVAIALTILISAC